MLATILATPCSAPFVGVAVGFALTGSIPALFGIFIALGIGLAAPWIVIMLVPGLMSALPRPGPWMNWLKRGLALLLVGTALWLASVLFVIAGPIIPGGLGRHHHDRVGCRTSRIWARPFVFAGAVIVVWFGNPPAILTSLRGDRYRWAIHDMDSLWQAWKPGRVGRLLSGQTFLSFYRRWCFPVRQ
ncbi:MAG: hypothetical protein CM15mP46_2250 [Alphaproteobacteria bacterium]|nr:MAG: hypothetical protein CM15mP46_2250 [Alphaproteobacteria bacterium]